MGINNLLEISFNWNLLITVVTYVLVVLVLAVGALKGMKRGLVRSSVRFGFLIAFILVAFFVTTPISKAILSIDGTFMHVEYNGEICKTIGEAIKGYILSIEEIANIANNSPSVMAIIEGLPVALVNVVVFFLLCWIMRLFSFIFYKIIDRTAIKSSKIERELKKQRKLQKKMEKKGKVAVTQSQTIVKAKPKHKALGALVGAIQAFVLLFLFLLPFNTLVGVVGDLKASAQAEQTTSEEGVYADSGVVIGTISVEEENENLNESVYDILKNLAGENIMSYFDSYNDSYAIKAVKVGGLNNTVFDEITKIETPNGVVKLRSEAISFVNSFDEVMRIFDFDDENATWKDADFAKLKVVVGKILDSDLLSAIIPEIAPYAVENYVYTSDAFTEMKFSEDLKTEINSILAEYKEVGFMDALKEDVYAVYDFFVSTTKTDLIDKIYNGASVSEIAAEFTKDDNKLFNEFIDTLYGCRYLKSFTVVGLNYANTMLEEQLELENNLQPYSKQLLFAESEKQSFKEILLSVLNNVDVISNLQSIEDLSNDDITTLSTLLTSLQNNAFKNYRNGVLEERTNAVLNKETLTVENGGAFSNLYLTLVNYVLGDYVPNINYKNADWQSVLTSVMNLIKSNNENPSVADVMAILSLDEDLGEVAKNIYDAFVEIETTDGISGEEISNLLTTVSDNIENLGEEKVDEIINIISDKMEIPEIKDNINYEMIMQEKETIVELANLFETQNDDISTEVLEKLAESELVVEQIAKYDVQIETADENIESKIETLPVSDDVKANLKAIFGIGE